MPNKKIQFVTEQELRRIFNETILTNEEKDKIFYEKVTKSKHPSRPRANEPFCTKSQFVKYYDENCREVAGEVDIDTYDRMVV